MEKVKIPCKEYFLEGEFYAPERETFPVVIMCHALGASKANFRLTANAFAQAGIGALTFDFRGGGNDEKSGFPTSEMSLFTEKEDLLCAFHFLKDRFFVKTVSLFGASQGGVVATMFAYEHPDKVSSLILLYPGFCMSDHLRAKFPQIENIPETFELFHMKLGRDYVLSAYDLDVFSKIKTLSAPALLFHGTKDTLVPISYSQRAARLFPNAKLFELEGEGHGFSSAANAFAAEKSIEFLKSL